MRTTATRLVVLIMSAVLVVACLGWAVLVQHVVPDACQMPAPPPRAQYLHCP